jgi:hypothetical protein
MRKKQLLSAVPGALAALAVALILAKTAEASTAEVDPALLCERAAAEAARQEGVPLSVLRAISLTETGRRRDGRFRPWPWTVNMEGAGHWFDSREEALSYALNEFDRGARSFDVGCFQINHKWHGAHFTSIEQMFEPTVNALYAARFLKSLYAEQGSWEAAAGAYHSRTPEYAERYAARFSRFRAALQDDGGEAIPDIPDIVLAAYEGDEPPSRPRINSFPLLQAGSGAGLGSLVPIGNAAGTMLFGGPVAGE